LKTIRYNKENGNNENITAQDIAIVDKYAGLTQSEVIDASQKIKKISHIKEGEELRWLN